MNDLLAPQTKPVVALLDSDYAAAAVRLGCEVAAIKAVAAVETAQSAFDAQGRPTILFERHVFHRLTHGAYDDTHPIISSPVAGGYGPLSMQYPKIAEAAALDLAAALQSASWGMFQIIGEYHAEAGFGTVQDFVAAMRSGAAAHLSAFVSFIRTNTRMLTPLREKNWPALARAYNGPRYAENKYDVRLAEEYAKHSNMA